jgi:hypothetical protein
VTWQIVTFALLALVVIGGFAWYERTRPSSRLLGLVAALAALAAAGRVALSPLPNVTPTTDIALLSGYSLGAPAGFAIGALAPLVSNFWLGQGPWTPWQMAAWGLAGIAGAVVARATGRRLGRWGLALACAVAGFLYGALLDLSVMVTYGGEQSLDRYLALSARGVPFNIAHAVGNAAFALAAGPAFVRILSRFRARLDHTWDEAPPPRRTAGAAGLAAALLVAVVVAGSVATPALAGEADARRYLERAQNRDGGLPSTPGGASSVAITGWAMLGMEASGRNPLDLRRAGNSPVDYLRNTAGSIRSTGDLERTILALDAAGVSPRSVAGRDLVAELARRRSANGSWEGQTNLTAFGILAQRATGTPSSALRRSAAWLRKAQANDGGWGLQPGARSDADSTGAALQALAAAGNRGRATSQGAAYLRRTQRGDGGWPLAFGGPTNAQSTAWAVQGLVAVGASPSISAGSRTPFDYLAARQAADGHYRYSATSDQTPVWVTGQALLATARKAFPLPTIPRASQPGGVPLPASSGGAGGGEAEADGGRDRGGEQGGGSDEPAEGRAGKRPQAAEDEQAVAGIAAESEVSAPGTGTYATAAAEDSGSSVTRWIAAGFAVLVLALAGGFFAYRRRLP